MSDIRITGVRAIETAPQPGCNLIVVRIDTNQPGLYGYGCATFTQRHKAVVTAIEEYMNQLLTGRDALEFIMAGAQAVQVGAASFANPRAMQTVAEEMAQWMDKNGVKTLDEIRGCAR